MGLLGLHAGALWAAAPALHALARSQGNTLNLSLTLWNLTDLAGCLGDTEEGIRTGTHALEVVTAHNRKMFTYSHALLGWVQDLAGATTTAEQHYHVAYLIQHTHDPDGHHLSSICGTRWAELLARTGRIPVARRLTTRNRELCTRHLWPAEETRCDRVLGRCDLAEGNLDAAAVRFQAAVDVLRNGEYLVEWAATLPDLAECHRRSGALQEAHRVCTEAVTAAAPRGLVPTHARALATRALVRGDQFAATGDRAWLERARDDAHAAERLATRTRRLPWQELDALRAHAYLDQLTGQDHGWQAKAEKLHAHLVPPDLDPDPLATIEAQVSTPFQSLGPR